MPSLWQLNSRVGKAPAFSKSRNTVMQNITKKETVLHDEHIELCICPIVQRLTELVTLKTILNINKEELTESYRRGSQNRCGVEGFFISCRSIRKELIIAYLSILNISKWNSRFRWNCKSFPGRQNVIPPLCCWRTNIYNCNNYSDIHRTYQNKGFSSFLSAVGSNSIMNLLKGSLEIPIPVEHPRVFILIFL